MAESFLYHLVNRPNSDLGDLFIIDMLLECVSNHDYEVTNQLSVCANVLVMVVFTCTDSGNYI